MGDTHRCGEGSRLRLEFSDGDDDIAGGRASFVALLIEVEGG